MNARRDVAMLGLVHWTVLGKGPHHSVTYFKSAGAVPDEKRQKLQLIEVESHVTDFMFPGSTEAPADYISRSGLGLSAV